MATVTGNSNAVRVGPGKIYVGPFGSVGTLPSTLAAANGDAALKTAGLRELGFTTEGSTLNYSSSSEQVEVAERLRGIKTVITGVEMTFEVTMAECSPENLALATGAPDSAITETEDEIKFVFPKSGGSQRVSIVWVADDGLEALILAKCFAGGDISIPRRKGAEIAAIGVTFNVEENSAGDDAWTLTDPALLA